MWRKALVGLVLLLPGCANFGDFLGNSFTYGTNPNLPAGNSENMRRVMGLDTPTGVLRTEPGNVWPTGIQSAPTLQELEHDTNTQATPPGQPAAPAMPGRAGAARPAPGAPPATPPTILTPQGPQAPANSGPGYQQIAPSPGQPGGIVIPNGNGTSTLIRPDGTVVTVPTPK